ncbi:MAG TPA: type 4a pilus biogenesis protein PilO [Gaiellaceae bacterium]|nr:type 4a pilus biogenesis protein PilO [Gaiellaceae bacterium]
MNTKQRVPPNAQIALVVVGVLLVAAIGWFALVHPKSASAGKLSKQIVDAQARLTQAQVAAAAAKNDKPVRVANLFRLVKAMPDSQDMSGILLQLNQVAQDSGITFESIKPSTMIPLGSYNAVPITLSFTGNFYDLSDFLLRLRTLVSVRHGALDATGRLFAIDTLTFGPATGGFPSISASLTVDAFIYGSGGAASPAPAPTPAPTDATSTDTTSTDATATPDGAAAAGAGAP